MYNNLNIQQRLEFEKIVNALGESLDISETQYNALVKSYEAVGTYLSNTPELSEYRPIVSPQGSLRLGTIIAPINKDDDIDVDLVFRLQEKAPRWTQKDIKENVGNILQNSPRYSDMLDEEGKRCWTLLYRQNSHNLKERYHMDILPCVASKDYDNQVRIILREDFRLSSLDKLSIRITDNTRYGYDTQTSIQDWLKSNPDGYAIWFAHRCKEKVATRQMLTEEIIPIGKYNKNKTPLQRIVQILKRHRDIKFNHDKKRPISIIITTLAAHAYQGESNILEGLANVVNHMEDYIKRDENGNDLIVNPLNPQENFADKWIKDPERRRNFYSWLQALKDDLNNILCSKGSMIWTNMGKSFGQDISESTNKRYTEASKLILENNMTRLSSTGMLGAVGDKLNASNTFYGKK